MDADRRLADVATESAAVLLRARLEAVETRRPDEVEQLLARVGEVLAQVVVDGDALALELRLQNLRDQRRTAAAGAGRLGLALERPDVVQPASTAAQIAPLLTLLQEQICASAGQRGQCRCPPGAGPPSVAEGSAPRETPAAADRSASSAATCRSRPCRRPARRRAAACRLRSRRASCRLSLALVDERIRARARRGGVRVADRGDVDAEQLQFRAHVGAGERDIALCPLSCAATTCAIW